jgi:hypothetical protein
MMQIKSIPAFRYQNPSYRAEFYPLSAGVGRRTRTTDCRGQPVSGVDTARSITIHEEEIAMDCIRNAGRVVCVAGMGLALAAATALAQEPIKIGAFLSVTGPAAFLGDPEQ